MMKSAFFLTSFILAVVTNVSAGAPTLLDGTYVLRVKGISSADKVESVFIPASNNKKTYQARHPDGRVEEVPGFGRSNIDLYGVLLRGAVLDCGAKTMKRNIIFPNVMNEQTQSARMRFFGDVFSGNFPTLDPFSSVTSNHKNKGKSLTTDMVKSADDVPWDTSVVLKAEISDAAVAVSSDGRVNVFPLIAFTGKEEDNGTEVFVGTAFYVNMSVNQGYSGTVRAPRSTLSGINLSSDMRILVGGLTTSSFADGSASKSSSRSSGRKPATIGKGATQLMRK